MSLIKASGAGESGDFYNGVATQSLRFDSGSSAYLYRTPSSAGNRRTFTWSAWIKRGVLDGQNTTGSSDTSIFTGGSGSTGYSVFRFNSQLVTDKNDLQLYTYLISSGVDYSEETSASFRDTSAWYHFVISVDTTQSTASNRIRYYVNGTEFTDKGQYYGQVPQNYDFHINNNVLQGIGRNIENTRYFDGYMAEVNFVDGTQYDASYFGVTKNGVWIPKTYTGSYGTNGYRLEFKNTSVGSGSSSTIGADTSGNNNHFDSSGIAASDCNMPDSPENNFCTLSSVHGASNSYTNDFQLKEGNLHLYNASSANQATAGTILMESGKWYWEIYIADTNSTYNHHIGVVNGASFGEPSSGPRAIYRNDGIVYYQDTSGNSANDTSPAAMVAGEVWAVALDADANTIKFYKAGSQTGNTISLDGPGGLGWKVITITGQASADNSYWNYGQDSSFAGQKTSGSAEAQDGNGIGDFYYSVPSGYLALCTSNLPKPDIGPDSPTQASDHFNTVLYTGNSSNGHSITGVGFQPDWTWIKARSDNRTHVLYDSTRGAGKYLSSDNDSQEGTDTTAFASFNSDGFTVGTSENYINNSSHTYVGWNWKANGGTTSSNSDGSITSTVQANTTAGFSIVTFQGNQTAGATVGHGLGKIPKMIILKNRNVDGNGWIVYDETVDQTDFLFLNNSNPRADNANRFNDTKPTSTVFSLGADGNINDSGEDIIAYCFTNIDGYSKIGSITGNGRTDGSYIYTGFRPAWIMVKAIDTTNDWFIYDIKRDTTNVVENILAPNLTNAESAVNTAVRNLDILSNGFKARGSDGFNLSGQLHIYMAFADQPFKYANAR